MGRKKKEEKVITQESLKIINEKREKLIIVKRDYGITISKFLPHQKEMADNAFSITRTWFDGKYINAPTYKYVVFQAGNGAGKSYWLYRMTTIYAMGKQSSKYGMTYLGEKKNIYIVTQSSSNVRDYVEDYLLGDYSPCRIPPDLIQKIVRGSDCVKQIILTNGCTITIKTVEQGQKRLVGGNPDLLVIDEPIDKDDVWGELIARLRSPKAQMLYGFTPINGYNASYYFLYEQKSEQIRKKTFLRKFASTENTTQDHSTLEAFNENERAVRMYGEFMPRSGLVYNQFNRWNNVIEKVNVKLLGPCRYYGGLDFGYNHPNGFTAIAVDEDGRVIVFDEIKQSGMLMIDLARAIKLIETKHKIKFEKIIADNAGAQQIAELKAKGLKVHKADKQSKGENEEKNRKAGISRINQMFYDLKLVIFDNCVELIKELTTHSYKDGTRDGEVNKINDDVIDALRYVIFSFRQPKVETPISRWDKKYKKPTKRAY